MRLLLETARANAKETRNKPRASSARERSSFLPTPLPMKPRLEALAHNASAPRLRRLLEGSPFGELSLDRVLNELMLLFRNTRSGEAFTLLYELSHRMFLAEIRRALRRYGSRGDPRDVLQEVFLCIYRYPRNFHPYKERSFRNWSRMVVQNAVRKFMKRNARHERGASLVEDPPERRSSSSPLRALEQAEERASLRRTYLISLALYLAAYHTYGKFLARKIFSLRPDAVCPSTALRDDVDYVPTKKPILFGQRE